MQVLENLKHRPCHALPLLPPQAAIATQRKPPGGECSEKPRRQDLGSRLKAQAVEKAQVMAPPCSGCESRALPVLPWPRAPAPAVAELDR